MKEEKNNNINIMVFMIWERGRSWGQQKFGKGEGAVGRGRGQGIG